MFQQADQGSHVYEVAVYNKDVRALVKNNKSHVIFGDTWADEQVQGVMARDEDEAREIAEQRFPPCDGFVVTVVQPLSSDTRFHV